MRTVVWGSSLTAFLAERADVDVYSFDARPGTEIWIDIDRTSQSLDSVVELVDANGLPLARSDNSLDESRGLAERFAAPGVQTFDLQKSLLNPKDHYSTNPRDAGLRLNLPGTGSEANTYHVRVRSSSPNINVLSAGQTFGNYQLQIRLQEIGRDRQAPASNSPTFATRPTESACGAFPATRR